MTDEFLHEQRRDVLKLNSLASLAKLGLVERFNRFAEEYLDDDILKNRVNTIRSQAVELYQKDLEARLPPEQRIDVPHSGVNDESRFTPKGSVPSEMVAKNWNDKEFFGEYVARFLTREAEMKERVILQASRNSFGLGR